MNAHAWMTMVFEESLAKIKRAVKIDVALAAIPEQKKLAMPESNAYELTKLPEKERAKPVWVNAAQNMPVAEFREKREKFIEEKFHVKREEWRTFAVRVPLAVYEKLIEAQVKVARLLELDIEDKPGNLIPVWEAIAALVNETPDERLVTEIEGKEDQCAAVGT